MKEELFRNYRELQSQRLLLREHEMCRGSLIDIRILSLLRKDRQQA